MVNFCSFNVRSINKKPKQVNLHDFLLKHAISFAGLVETRVKAPKAINISNTIYRSGIGILIMPFMPMAEYGLVGTPIFGMFMFYPNSLNSFIVLSNLLNLIYSLLLLLRMG